MKKLLVLAITLCLLMSVCPVGVASAYHNHYSCGISGTHSLPYHYHERSTSYNELSTRSALYVNVGEIGYYLTGDTTIDTISISGNGKVYLCLNGYTLYHDGISLTGDYPLLYLCDCKGSGKVMPKSGSSAGIDVNAGSLYMYSGTITGHTNTAIRLGRNDEDAQGRFEMLGGEISGNSGGNGGGISCTAGMSNLLLHGGVIKNNTASRGGGIYLSRGNHEISMIEISGNSAVSGGGIYMTVTDAESFCQSWISGVTITGNRTAGGMGGGMYVDGSTSLFLGNSTICDNTSNGVDCNLYLPAAFFEPNHRGAENHISLLSINRKVGFYVGIPVTSESPLSFLSDYNGILTDADIAPLFSDQGYTFRLVPVNEYFNACELCVPAPTPTPVPAPVPAPPATGDNTPVLLWAAVLLMTAGAAMLLRRRMAK